MYFVMTILDVKKILTSYMKYFKKNKRILAYWKEQLQLHRD